MKHISVRSFGHPVAALMVALALIWGGPARAAGPTLLVVSGAIEAGPEIAFDRAALEALGARTIQTTTIWTDGVTSFTGVPLSALLEAVGAQGTVLRASAINDYSVEIPAADAVPDGPIIAYLRDGSEMSLRDKGPLWIVYPYDADPSYQTEQIYARSIWQLDRIEILD